MKKLLIVDDEPDVCELLQTYFESRGFTVLTASRALRGLELVELEKPDAMMLDVVMPDMDGIEVLKKIKQTSPEVIVIIMSGLQDEGVAKEAIRHGAYDYITKPFDLTFLETGILGRIFPS